MSKALRYKLKFHKRTITNDGSGLVTLFLSKKPDYLPEVGDNILIRHTELPSGSSGIKNKITNISTNAAIAEFNEYIEDFDNQSINDNYTYFIVVKYKDLDYANNTGGGNTKGYIEYEVNPTNIEALKSVESSVIVTDVVPYDDSDGFNSISGITNGPSQTSTKITPFMFVERGQTNTTFSNLYSAFNIPLTNSEAEYFTQSKLGDLIESSTGEFLINGIKYNWVENHPNGNTTHPTSGNTGPFYNNAYQYLAVENNTAASAPIIDVVSRILVIEIPNNEYGEIIDGKSIKLTLPSSGGISTYTIYSAYKKNTTKYNSDGLDSFLSENDYNAGYFNNDVNLSADEDLDSFESNVALLFADDIKKPLGNSGKSWATGWLELINGEKVYSPSASVKKEFFDFEQDQPVGIAYLDKGFVVITNQTIVDGFYAELSSASGTAANLIDGQYLMSSGYGGTLPTMEYLSYNTNKSLNIVCVASSDEFFRSLNETAKELTNEVDKVYADLKSGGSSSYPARITEVGLYDENGELLALCKPNKAIDKLWFDIIPMNIKIRL